MRVLKRPLIEWADLTIKDYDLVARAIQRAEHEVHQRYPDIKEAHTVVLIVAGEIKRSLKAADRNFDGTRFDYTALSPSPRRT